MWRRLDEDSLPLLEQYAEFVLGAARPILRPPNGLPKRIDFTNNAVIGSIDLIQKRYTLLTLHAAGVLLNAWRESRSTICRLAGKVVARRASHSTDHPLLTSLTSSCVQSLALIAAPSQA